MFCDCTSTCKYASLSGSKGYRRLHKASQPNASKPDKIMRTRFATLICFAFWLFLAQLAWAADSLTFFNNWFVTGDYVVAGVGLRGGGAGHGGWATGNINVAGVPNNAQPIAAFLYWSTVEKTTTPSAAVGYFNGN